MECKIYIPDRYATARDGTIVCPECFQTLTETCSLDHICKCSDDITGGMQECVACGKPTCKCGCHDVMVISRITGYLAELDGWNPGKKQEFKDRVRYDI